MAIAIQKRIVETSPSAPGVMIGTVATASFAQFDTIRLYATLTGGTGGALDVVLEESFDQIEWFEFFRFPQVAAGVTETWRATSVLQDGIMKVGLSSLLTSQQVIAANTNGAGPWGDFIRAKYIAGAGTTAGATQIIRLVGTTSSRA
jgi:hypothetical protein